MTSTADETAITFPGARRPDRSRRVDASGVPIAVYEWGDEAAPPILLSHGGFDFAATFDLLAPLLADGGWRVVAWDQRGHGDSGHSSLYSWEADMRDAVAVMSSVATRAMPVLGHSKGGALMLELADAAPYRVSHLVNLDGLPSKVTHPDVVDRERTRLKASELSGWLDFRRQAATNQRKPGTIHELAARRGRMNPRLSQDWLRYIVTIGARQDPDGWRWKFDPLLRMGGFGPWRPQWSLTRTPGLGMPMLGMLGMVHEPMGWATQPDDVQPYLPPGARIVALEDTGHFVHVERPRVIADAVLEFLS
ncbi:MAG TPA: alpha/beta hydrolase [Acidimicrobiales bacterium]